MKAIILAAGRGTRMGKYTENLPKGMLVFENKTLIERQIETLRQAGVSDIAIATGYESQKINYENIKYYHNADWATTNMVETLMCAEEFLDDDILVAYSDILYTANLVKQCIDSKCDIGVAVDSAWKNLWKLRYGKIDFDLESLTVKDGLITELGREIETSENLEYRYIGLIKYSKKGMEILKNIYNKRKAENLNWTQSGKEFKKGYMTDILAEIINSGNDVKAIAVKGNWMEFDTEKDYEIISQAKKDGKISEDYQITA
ncbi:MAG: phosphocholine cytidylyltransferase family protein [Candidatus Gastranaerophilales bacterium]|nr:phosphocholine cytidylyltransferase family protein [Candidatus Gastranaerophilales bacterium]